MAPSRPASSPRPNSAWLAATTASRSCGPCTSAVSSSASARCASRACGRSATAFSSASISSRLRNESTFRQVTTSASSVLSQNWKNAYGDVSCGVEPERSALRLAELGPVGLRQQRRRERVHRRLLDPVDEVEPGRQVAPLVAAAELQGAAVAAEQLEEVQALQELVAELGVGDALLGVQPGRDGVLGDHLVDAEVLADVPQEVDRRHRARSSRGC